MIRKFHLAKSDSAIRLDQYLANMLPEHSRSYLQKLVKVGRVTLDGSPVCSCKLQLPTQGVILVDIPEIDHSEVIESEEFNFELLYEDDFMAVINKPPGVVVHPGAGNSSGTVANALLSRYPELRSNELPDGSRPGIVHRLDKDTSGCLAIARTPEAQANLSDAFAERETGKIYLALTAGIPRERQGRIENLIGRHAVNRQKMAIVEKNGKLAISEYEVIKCGMLFDQKTALVKVRILTGRTHQIRVHLASLGAPVLGDEIYGGKVSKLDVPRQMLHAWRLKLPHPRTHEILKFQAPLPEDFQTVYKQIKFEE